MITRPESIHATLSVREAAVTTWDVIIVGADLAGILAAHELGRLGAKTLLVDRDQLPHNQPGGCYLGPAAGRALTAAQAMSLLDDLPTLPLDQLTLAMGTQHLHVPLSDGWALARAPLEAALLRRAIDHGVELLTSTEVLLDPEQGTDGLRHLLLSGGGDTVTARGQVILPTAAACQLPHRPSRRWLRKRPPRWIGACTALPEAPSAYRYGTMHLACDRRGMLTLVRLADGQLQIHGLFARLFLDQQRTPARTAAQLLEMAQLPPLELTPHVWRATTSPAALGPIQWGPRLLPLGTPSDGLHLLTGADTAHGLLLARGVVPLVLRCLDGWHHEQAILWQQRRSGILRQPYSICRAAQLAVRHRHLMRWGATLAERFPRLSQPGIRAIAREPRTAAT